MNEQLPSLREQARKTIKEVKDLTREIDAAVFYDMPDFASLLRRERAVRRTELTRINKAAAGFLATDQKPT